VVADLAAAAVPAAVALVVEGVAVPVVRAVELVAPLRPRAVLVAPLRLRAVVAVARLRLLSLVAVLLRLLAVVVAVVLEAEMVRGSEAGIDEAQGLTGTGVANLAAVVLDSMVVLDSIIVVLDSATTEAAGGAGIFVEEIGIITGSCRSRVPSAPVRRETDAFGDGSSPISDRDASSSVRGDRLMMQSTTQTQMTAFSGMERAAARSPR
jgi:hypothetical protein